MEDFIRIDGSIGGGSVLRVAVPLAISLNKKIEIYNIRANRPKPGLRLQHLTGLQIISEISNSKLSNCQIGSTRIKIKPQKDKPDFFEIAKKFNTAASISLIGQILANYAFATQTEIDFYFNGGGTHTSFAPNFDYLENVASPMYKYFGIEMRSEIEKVGFYPKGGAKGSMSMKPTKILSFPSKKQMSSKLSLTSIASNHLKKAKVAERQASIIETSKLEMNIIDVRYVDTKSPGSSLTVVQEFENGIVQGYAKLGAKGIRAEEIGLTVLNQIKTRDTIIDQYMGDQILLPFILNDKIRIIEIPKMTKHVETNISIINQIWKKDKLGITKHENTVKIYKKEEP